MSPRKPLRTIVVLSVIAVLEPGCRRDASEFYAAPSATKTDDSSGVLLAGEFRGIVKQTQGRAELVRQAEKYELRLRGVRIASQERPVRVYLVGVASAMTTRSVVDAELKYDMAALEPGVAEQIIALPSEPDTSLRSVVLWEPAFGINLASAELRQP